MEKKLELSTKNTEEDPDFPACTNAANPDQ